MGDLISALSSDVIKAEVARPSPGVTRPAGHKAKASSIKAKAWSHKTKTEILVQNYNHIGYKVISVYQISYL